MAAPRKPSRSCLCLTSYRSPSCHFKTWRGCASLIPRCGFPISPMSFFRFGARKIATGGSKACAKPGCRSDRHGRSRRGDRMRRREFIQLTGAAISWPIAARAQQRERVWRIGVLMLYSQDEPEGRLRAVAFRQGLGQAGWISGRNLQIDYHWGIGDDGWIRSAVAELLSTAPDVILANGGPAMRPVQQATRTVPIIFI